MLINKEILIGIYSFSDSTSNIWTGLGSNNDWSTNSNWNFNTIPVPYNSLYFGSAARYAPNNNLAANTPYKAITFNNDAGAYTITGNSFMLYSEGIVNNSLNLQVITNNISLSGTAGITFNCNTAAINLSGIISGANSLIKTGTNTLSLNGVNIYTGGTVVSGDTIKIGSQRALGTGQLTLTPNTVLDLNGYALKNYIINDELADIVSDVTSKIINSGNNIPFVRSECFSPKTGTIFAQIDDTLVGGVGGTISIRLGHAGSDTTLANANNKIRGKVILTGGSTTTVVNLNVGTFGTGDIECGNQSTTQTLIYNGSINSDIGSRDIVLTNNSTGSGGGLIIRNNGSGLLTLSGVYAFNGTVNKLLTLGGINTGDNIVQGVIRNAATNGIISVTKTGTGKWVLSGANTYTGLTRVGAGTLKLSGANMWKTGRTYTIDSAAVLNLDGGVNFGTGTNATTTINGTGTLLLTNGTYYKGSIIGANITMGLSAGGLINIQVGASLYNGGWSAWNWTNNKASMNVEGNLNVADSSVTIDALNGNGSITKTVAGAVNLTVGISNGTGTYGGLISNASGSTTLVKTGSGTQTLSGVNTYTGATSIVSGNLVVVKVTADLASQATATFTPTQLSVAFSPPLLAPTTVQFFQGSTTQSYAPVILIGAPGRSGTYNSTNSTLTIT